jgi:hypothetical protein
MNLAPGDMKIAKPALGEVPITVKSATSPAAIDFPSAVAVLTWAIMSLQTGRTNVELALAGMDQVPPPYE